MRCRFLGVRHWWFGGFGVFLGGRISGVGEGESFFERKSV